MIVLDQLPLLIAVVSANNRPANATHWVKRPLKGFQQNQKADAHRRAVS
jgi:hypothetical protein